MVVIFLVSFVLLGGTLALSVQQRTEHFTRLSSALDADQMRSAVAVCVQDLQQQLALTSQTLAFQPGEDGLEPTTRDQLTGALDVCRDHAAAFGASTVLGDERGLESRLTELLGHWREVSTQIGTERHTDALTTLAVKADPLAAVLLTEDLPDAGKRYAIAVEEAREAFDLSAQTGDLLVIVVGLLALVAAALVVVTVLSLERGVRALLQGTAAYKVGRLTHTIDAPDSQEFQEVATQMNEMALSLIDAQRELEDRASRLQDSLEELEETQGQLVEERKMAALGNLVAGVAHEVNTPLGVAITANSLLDDQLRSLAELVEGPQVSRRALREATLSGREAADLLGANLARAADLIRSFKQVAVDRSHIETRTLVLDEWLRSVASSLSPLLRKHSATLDVVSPPGLVVQLSAGELEQVLTNLCVNAVLHGYPPPHQRAAPHSPVEVRIRCTLEAERLALSVEDDGAGMSPDVLEKVFDPFFTTKRGNGGTGLGMHIVHQVVTTGFGGTISVNSAPGAGTAWRLDLPLGSPALRLGEERFA